MTRTFLFKILPITKMSAEIEIKPSRILDAIRKMLDDIVSLPLEGNEFEDVKSNTNLASAIIDKTEENSSFAIINRFYNYYTSNKKAFLDRNQDAIQSELPLTKKISIAINSIIEKTGRKSSQMWQHLTLIFYLISLYKKQPDQKLKQLLENKLEEESPPISDDEEENKLEEESPPISDDEEEKKSPPEPEQENSESADGFIPVSNRKNLRRTETFQIGRKKRKMLLTK